MWRERNGDIMRRARGGRTKAFRGEQMMLHVARSSLKSTRAAALVSRTASQRKMHTQLAGPSLILLFLPTPSVPCPLSLQPDPKEREQETEKKPRTRKKKPGEQKQISGGYQLRSKTKGQTSREKEKLPELETPACAPHSSLFSPLFPMKLPSS